VVYFLIHADNGKYRAAFEKLLELISKGQSVQRAFSEAFQAQDNEAFRKRWEEYIHGAAADR